MSYVLDQRLVAETPVRPEHSQALQALQAQQQAPATQSQANQAVSSQPPQVSEAAIASGEPGQQDAKRRQLTEQLIALLQQDSDQQLQQLQEDKTKLEEDKTRLEEELVKITDTCVDKFEVAVNVSEARAVEYNNLKRKHETISVELATATENAHKVSEQTNASQEESGRQYLKLEKAKLEVETELTDTNTRLQQVLEGERCKAVEVKS